MTRRIFSSGSKFEEIAAYSRAVADDGWVTVSGTVGIDPASGKPPDAPAEQAVLAFNVIERALAQAGASLRDVMHYRLYVTALEHIGEVLPVCREKFKDIRPANTTLICGIPAEGAKVEIEVMAYVASDARSSK